MQRPSCLQKIYPDKVQSRFQIPFVTNKIFNLRKLHRKRQNLCKMQINLKKTDPYADHPSYKPPNLQSLRITRKEAKPAWKLYIDLKKSFTAYDESHEGNVFFVNNSR